MAELEPAPCPYSYKRERDRQTVKYIDNQTRQGGGQREGQTERYEVSAIKFLEKQTIM